MTRRKDPVESDYEIISKTKPKKSGALYPQHDVPA